MTARPGARRGSRSSASSTTPTSDASASTGRSRRYQGPVDVDYIPVDNTAHAFSSAGAALEPCVPAWLDTMWSSSSTKTSTCTRSIASSRLGGRSTTVLGDARRQRRDLERADHRAAARPDRADRAFGAATGRGADPRRGAVHDPARPGARASPDRGRATWPGTRTRSSTPPPAGLGRQGRGRRPGDHPQQPDDQPGSARRRSPCSRPAVPRTRVPIHTTCGVVGGRDSRLRSQRSGASPRVAAALATPLLARACGPVVVSTCPWCSATSARRSTCCHSTPTSRSGSSTSTPRGRSPTTTETPLRFTRHGRPVVMSVGAVGATRCPRWSRPWPTTRSCWWSD